MARAAASLLDRDAIVERANAPARSLSAPMALLPGLMRVADTLASGVAAFLPAWLFWRTPTGPALGDLGDILLGIVLLQLLLQVFGAYRPGAMAQVHRSLARCLIATIGAAAVVLVTCYALRPHGPDTQAWLLAWFVATLTALSAVRLLLAAQLRSWSARSLVRRRVALVGAGPLGQHFLRRVGEDVDVVGLYDDRLERLPKQCLGHPIAGSTDRLLEDFRHKRIDLVVIALPLAADRRVIEILRKLRALPVDIALCPDQAGLRLTRHEAHRIGDLTLLGAAERPLAGWDGVAKALLDRALAAAILLGISPLLLTIAAAVRIDSPGPVLFRQKRYGFNNQLIEVFKFRTMRVDATDRDAERLTTRNDPRVTRVGAFLRRTSLDELPQFLNVLRGDMSVVGPRPHALAAKAGGLLYPEAVRDYFVRHRVKPGITGWAQVNGWRGETETVEQIARRVEHDLYYIDHWSIGLDLRIVVRTVLGGFAGRNAY